MITAAKNKSFVSAKKIVAKKQDTLFKTKSEIMKERQLRAIEVVPVNHTHSVFLHIDANPGITIDTLRAVLPDIGQDVIIQALNSLFTGGYIARTATGEFNQRGNPLYYYRVSGKEYSPRAVVRKVAPNDKKALKSIAKKKAPKEEPAERQIEMVKGIVAVDPTDPVFQEVARDIIPDVKQDIPRIDQGPVKPIVTLFLEIGNQSIIATPQQAYQLWQELDVMFGPKD